MNQGHFWTTDDAIKQKATTIASIKGMSLDSYLDSLVIDDLKKYSKKKPIQYQIIDELQSDAKQFLKNFFYRG